MTVGILECGLPPAALCAEHGSYATMVERLLGPGHDFVSYDVAGGVLPAASTPCEAYVLTGSSAGVYDDLPWIAGLIGFLQQAKGRSKLVGICFGHQAMAQAFGGSVVKAPQGWGVGLHRYALDHRADWMDDVAHIDAAASHQDQVVTCPPGARIAAASAFTPYAALDYGDAISFQFHPEFTPGFAVALIEATPERYGALAAPAIASHQQPDDGARVGRWVNRFLDAA